MELILNTFGLSLNRDNEAFVITKKGERHRIPVDDVITQNKNTLFF